jgi:lipopolysaccharide biosynthesis glycosyltransferase
VQGDVCELAAIDLGDTPLASRTSIFWATDVWRKAGNRLEPEVAFQLRRTMAAKMPASLPTFNAGVLVLDLARMRADRFTAWALAAAATYGLNDQDLLLAYVGADRTELDRRWNHWPSMETLDDPAIVHFVGGGKPWTPVLTPGADIWDRWRRVSLDRVGTPPDEAQMGSISG